MMTHEKGRAPVSVSGPAGARPAGGLEPDRYRAAWWLPGAHAQTIAGRLIRNRHATGLRRERLELPDGDFLDIDHSPAGDGRAPVVLVLHGLEGSARRGYALNTYRALNASGVHAVGLNFRSCSGEPNRLARSYHSGETGDLNSVLEWLAGRYPDVPMAVIGFSLGGNVLLKWLGESGDAATSRLMASAAVSVPFDLAVCERALDGTPMGRFYVRRFLKTLIAKVEAKAHLLADLIDLEAARRAGSFRDFDDAVTAPVHGFDGVDDYYARSSSAPFLPRVRVPTLVLHARDDPFMPGSGLPLAAIDANPAIRSVITDRGGHVGFASGSPLQPVFWAEIQAARFLTHHLRRAWGPG